MKDLASLYLRRNGDATLVAQALALAVTKQAMKPTPEQQAMRDSENRAMGFLAVQYLNADKSLPEIRDKALLDLKELLEEK